MNNIFEIEDLLCSYNDSDIVLKIKKLDIPKGKMSVFLGVSGSGKSTFLETLGLMNNTIHSGKIKFYPENNNNNINFREVWKKNGNNLPELRNKYFSFIFQSTNLMPNFTVLENICITQMIQGISMENSLTSSENYLERVKLNNIDDRKNISEFSGGERQRIAFVRAIAPNFQILFGDEPTGNLDECNARELMGIIRDEIEEDKNRAAIIVSHNIDLALEFADQIVIIDKKENSSFGEINNSGIFYRNHYKDKDWYYYKNDKPTETELKDKIIKIVCNTK